LLIVANVVAVILGTIPAVSASLATWLSDFESFSIAVFTLEYLARLWSAPGAERFGKSSLASRLRYARSPLAVVDLAVILPAYLGGLGTDLRVLRTLRLFRLFRVAKLIRYVKATRIITSVVHKKREQLLVIGIALLILLVISSSLLYAVEHDVQPDKFSTIPEAMWWAIATLTTVGYGDVYPITPLGKVLGAFIAIGGIAFFALPAGVLGAGFLEELEHTTQPNERSQASDPVPPREMTCPHCGARLTIESRLSPTEPH
jgi:voltage-gated potassium channel